VQSRISLKAPSPHQEVVDDVEAHDAGVQGVRGRQPKFLHSNGTASSYGAPYQSEIVRSALLCNQKLHCCTWALLVSSLVSWCTVTRSLPSLFLNAAGRGALTRSCRQALNFCIVQAIRWSSEATLSKAHLHCIAHKHGKRQQESEAPCQLRIDDLYEHGVDLSHICAQQQCMFATIATLRIHLIMDVHG
jgi:hypothetical protein